MNHQKLFKNVKRALAGILVVGMVLTGMPVTAVEAANEIPEQTQPGQEISTSENSVEEPDDETGESDDIGPGDDDNVSGDDQGMEESQPGTENEEDEPDEKEATEDEDDLNAVYLAQVSGNGISGNDLAAYEDEENEGKRVVGGYIELPEDRDVSVVDEFARIYDYEGEIAPLMSDVLPAQYIPEKGTLPLTRSQSPYGSCWAHSAMALAEVDMMRNGGASSDVDYSELHLAYFSYSGAVDDPLGGLDGDSNTGVYDEKAPNFMERGGNLSLARYVLANWVGAADESTAPYEQAKSAIASGLPKEIAFADVVHLQNAFQVNLQENRDIAKQMILEYGGVGISYFDDEDKLGFFNKSYTSYYCCDTEKKTNHAVTIVGWDDSFSADKFGTKPEGDGAWLIRNSWVAGEDTDARSRYAYFWMSYYDKSLGAGYVLDFEDAGNYDHNYQYDGSMQSRCISAATDRIYTANVFTAKACEEGERLEAVGIMFEKAQTPYTVSIYKNLTDMTNPESGEKIEAATTSGTCVCEGFYTVPLKSPVSLAKGDTFSVVVKYGAPENEPNKVYVPFETSISTWYRCVASAQAGQSFYKNGSWTDFGMEYGGNLRIKAYTIDDDGGAGDSIKIQITGASRVTAGETLTLQTVRSPSSVAATDVQWSSSDERVLTVDGGVVTGVAPGYATITAGIGEIKDTKEVTCEFPTFTYDVSMSMKGLMLTWPGGPGATKYQIYRVEGESWTNPELLATITADGRDIFSYLDKNLEGNKRYIYEVVATVNYLNGNSIEEKTASSGRYKVSMPELYSITYHLNGGENNSSNPEFYEPGHPYNYVYDPSRFGYDFAGWYLDESLTEKLESRYLPTTMTGNLDLYAGWTPIVYQIIYRLNGGTNATDPITSYTIETDTFTLPEPTRVGYHFDGWYKDSAFTEPITEVVKGSTGNLWVYAKWQNVIEVTDIRITGDPRDSITVGETLRLRTLRTPSSIPAADVQWSSSDERVLKVDADGVVTGIAPGYAVITAGIGKVTDTREITCEFPGFSCRSDASIEGITLTWPGGPGAVKYQIYRVEGESWTNPELLATVTADGSDTYSYQDKNVEGKKNYIYEIIATVNYIKETGIEEKTVSSDHCNVTMPEIFFITYHLNGGENSNSNPTFYKSGYSYNSIYDPKSRPGYRFTGWYFDENLTQKLETGYLPVTMTGDLDLYAGWTPIVYQITYQLNGGTNAADQITSYTIETDTFTLREPTRAGYHFGGWYTDSALTKPITEIAKGSIGTRTLYAKWVEIGKKITYELDGGTNSQNNPSEYVSTMNFVLESPTKDGYDFQGWYIDGSFKNRIIRISGSTTTGSDMTLYAKWSIHTYRITYILYGGTNSAENPSTYTIEDAVIVLKEAVKEGRVFEGWYSDQTYKQKVTQIMPEDIRDITLFAKWQGEEAPTDGALESGVLTLKSESLVYTGAEQKPEVTLTLKGVLLVEGRDYTITCYNNKDVGTAMMVAEGIGNYHGYLSSSFVITPAEIRIRAKDKTILIGASIPDDYEYEVSGLLADDRLIIEPVMSCDITEADIQKAGQFTITPSGADAGPNYTITYEEGQLIVASEYFAIEVTEDIYYYTGKAWKPVVNVYDGDTMLKAGRDYTVKYFNNINANAGGVWKKGSGQGNDFNAGIPYVQISGKGNYTDEIKVNFDIHPAVIADQDGKPAEKVVLKYTDQFVAAKKVLKPFGSIKYSKAMKLNQDYTLTLKAVDVRDGSGVSVPSGKVFDNAAIPAGYEGEFMLTVAGKGNYVGSISKSVHVTDKLHLMKNAKITLGKNQKSMELVGESVELTPSTEDSADTFTVKFGRTILTPGQDYKVSYLDKSNERVGKATLVITGVGDYSGTKTAAFTVKGKAFTAGKITVTGIENKVYTGRAITQNDAVLVYNAGRSDEKELKYGTDYTISYAKNINKGTATMTFTGAKKRGFSGSFKKSFKIAAVSIDTVKRGAGWDTIAAEYSKVGAKPVSEIVLTNDDGKKLQNGKDYTLSYKNNKLVADAADEKAPTITVKGKGNYQGSFSIPFTITEADLRTKISNGEITVKVAAVAYQQNKPGDYAYKPAVKLMEGNKALRLGADYTVTYINNTQADYEAYIESAGRAGASAMEPLAVIAAGSDNTYLVNNESSTEPGDESSVKPNEIAVPLTIYRNKLTKANLRVDIPESERVYTGVQVRPRPENIVVRYKDGNDWILLTPNVDYEVSYGANVKSGKKAGRVTISGIGTFYGGDVTVNFEIFRKKIKY